MKLPSRVLLLATPWTAAYQAPNVDLWTYYSASGIKNVWSILFAPNLHLLHLLYHLEASPRRYFSSFAVVQLLTCVWLCDSLDCSTPGFPVLHCLPEFAPTHIHWVGDAIQPSHPLSLPSPPAFNLSYHQGHFQWVSSSNLVAKVLELWLQH